MATGSAGADSSQPVTAQVSGQSIIDGATGNFGATPVFWGRYFTSPTTGGTIEYRGQTESPVLNAAGIPVLPVARQIPNVGGDSTQGIADAHGNVDDLFDTFGIKYLASLGSEFYIFLDVEGPPNNTTQHQSSLSLDYYTGWAQTLVSYSMATSGGTVQISPCVYGPQGDGATWSVIAQAVGQGIPCAGLWIARYPFQAGTRTPLPCNQLPDWSLFRGPSVALTVPVLAWQYAGNCVNRSIDCSVTNPGIDLQGDLLDHLILPPAPA